MSKKPKIIVKNLTKKFGNREVLKNISFEVYEKEIFILMGGMVWEKHTLKHIIGLLRPQRKHYNRWCRYNKLSKSELIKFRKKLGYLFQEGALFDSLKVWENVGSLLPTPIQNAY